MATIIRNGKLFCTKCGGEYMLNYPIGVVEFGVKTKAFEKLHKNCKQTWVEPTADLSVSIIKRAQWWWDFGERGASSQTIWHFFMGSKRGTFSINIPYDPDDFKRCYKLFQAIPEWRAKIFNLKSLSPQWDRLVQNWDKLTEMYERSVSCNWEDDSIGMYEFMQIVISDNNE